MVRPLVEISRLMSGFERYTPASLIVAVLLG